VGGGGVWVGFGWVVGGACARGGSGWFRGWLFALPGGGGPAGGSRGLGGAGRAGGGGRWGCPRGVPLFRQLGCFVLPFPLLFLLLGSLRRVPASWGWRGRGRGVFRGSWGFAEFFARWLAFRPSGARGFLRWGFSALFCRAVVPLAGPPGVVPRRVLRPRVGVFGYLFGVVWARFFVVLGRVGAGLCVVGLPGGHAGAGPGPCGGVGFFSRPFEGVGAVSWFVPSCSVFPQLFTPFTKNINNTNTHLLTLPFTLSFPFFPPGSFFPPLPLSFFSFLPTSQTPSKFTSFRLPFFTHFSSSFLYYSLIFLSILSPPLSKLFLLLLLIF